MYPAYRRHHQAEFTDSKGFTLVELIVIVAIISILSMIAFSGLNRWIPNYRLKAATQVLYADFQKAKMHATKNNRGVRFTFTTDPACSAATSYVFTDTDGTVVAQGNMADGVCITNSTFVNLGGVNESGFDPKGLPAGNVGMVELGHESITRKRDITQSAAGSIRIN